jgi:hypothetical protein
MEKANVVERIMAKLVGSELTVEEMEMVAGGMWRECVGDSYDSPVGSNGLKVCDAA